MSRNSGYLPPLVLLVAVASGSLFDPETSGAADCARPTSPKEVVACVLENHPDLKRARLEQAQSSRLEDLARQRPNPELDSKIGLLPLTEDAPKPSEFTLLHTLELGGKRSSRIEKAQAQLKQTESTVQSLTEELAIQVNLQLQRLRQIEEELAILTETASTFGKQAKLLRNRGRLTPEQEVSLSVFSLAHEDAELKSSLLQGEKAGLIQGIILGLGAQATFQASWLPKEPSNWPDPNSELQGAPQSARMKRAQSEVSLSQSELSLSQSEAWPDLKLGPHLETESALGQRSSVLGVSFSLPLPLFHRNGGAKAVAEAGVLRAEESLKLTETSVRSERELAVSQYRIFASKLKGSKFHQEYEGRHRKIESLFARGVLASAIVIEAHRQVLEIQKTSHELELKALQALYRIRVLDGALPEANL